MATESKSRDTPDVGATSADERGPSTGTMVALYSVIGINQGCMFIYLGVMPFLFKQYGMDPVTFSYLTSAFAFSGLVASPALGRIADVFGSRTVLILSMLSASAAHLAMATATGIPALIASRGVSLLMDLMPAAQMAVTDIAAPAQRGRYLGKIMIPMSAGMIIGPTLGGTLSKYLGAQGTLMLTWMAPLLCIFIIVTFIPATKKTSVPAAEDEDTAAPKKASVDWRHLGAFLRGDIPYLFVMRILSTLPGMIFMMNFQLAGINFFKLTPQGNGMVVSCLGLFNMFNNWFTLGAISRRVHADRVIRWTPVLSVATYFALSHVTQVWQLVAMLYPINLCYTVMENQMMTRLTKSVAAKDTSTMVGVATALFYVSRTVAPVAGGVLMNNYGWPAIGQLGFVVSIVMASLSLARHR